MGKKQNETKENKTKTPHFSHVKIAVKKKPYTLHGNSSRGWLTLKTQRGKANENHASLPLPPLGSSVRVSSGDPKPLRKEEQQSHRENLLGGQRVGQGTEELCSLKDAPPPDLHSSHPFSSYKARNCDRRHTGKDSQSTRGSQEAVLCQRSRISVMRTKGG